MKNVGQIAKKFDVVLQNGSTTVVGRTPRQVDGSDEIKRLNMLFENLRSTYKFWMDRAMDIEDDKKANKSLILSGKDERALEHLTTNRKKWLSHLHLYTDEQISGAVIKCEETISRLSGPTIAEFLSFCKGTKWVAAHQDFDMSKALPAPNRVNQSVGESALDKLKRELKY